MSNAINKFNILPFYTLEMMKYAAELEARGNQVYHLEVGQPIASTPQPVLDAAAKALREQQFSYCSALGHLELRQAIAKHYQDINQLLIDPQTIVITPGSSMGLYTALLMNFHKGDKIAIASPSYPCYRNVMNALQYFPVEIATTREGKYLVTPEALDACGENIAGLLIASPNNPTGSIYDETALKALTDYCKEKNIYMIADELYHGITYEAKAPTLLQFNRQCTVINGFSKYFAMTGWRLGWMVVPQDDIRRYESLLQNLILCTSSLTQIAGTAAFSAYAELNQHVADYKINRDILHQALTAYGLNVYKPHGGFYLYVELEHIPMDSMALCLKLLEEQQVAISPGMDFMSNPAHCSVRLSFCQKKETIIEAADRITTFIDQLSSKKKCAS